MARHISNALDVKVASSLENYLGPLLKMIETKIECLIRSKIELGERFKVGKVSFSRLAKRKLLLMSS